MSEAVAVCGRVFTPAIIEHICEIINRYPEWTRSQLAREVCEWLDWRNHRGQLKAMSCRKALLALDRRGLIDLPAAKRQIPAFCESSYAQVELELAHGLSGEVGQIGELRLILVTNADRRLSAQWKRLVADHHYLGYRPLCGAQMRYLITTEHGHVGALGFRSAALRSKARDRWIGWSAQARDAYIGKVVCNARFVIVDSVRVKNLASKALAMAAQRLPEDWQRRYGIRPVLMETYVDPTRFKGSCYQGAGWEEIGETRGRGKTTRKTILVRALSGHFREQLCEEPGAARLNEVQRWRQRMEAPATDWAEREFGRVQLGDERLHKRLLRLARAFEAQPQANIPQACAGLSQARAAYRFLRHKAVSMNTLLAAHYQATMERIAAAHPAVVLTVQDSTSLNFAAHPAMEGTGPLNNRQDKARGLWMHDTVAYSVEGRALGLIDVQLWARGEVGCAAKRQSREIEDKESHKWLKSLEASMRLQRQLGPQTTVVSVGDREADIYELFVDACKVRDGAKLLIRGDAKQRRMGGSEQKVWEWMAQRPASSQRAVAIPRRAGRKARTAELEMRFGEVELKPPNGKAKLGPVKLWSVYVTERGPAAAGEKPIEWMLWTNVEVSSDQQAWQRVEWYRRRWEIEEYHRTLKSGCRIEDRQLETRQQFESCLALDLVVAWRIQNAKKLGREQPDVCASELFEPDEIAVLKAVGEPSDQEAPMTLRQAVRRTAAFGGFLGRNSDGEPGSITLWRGLVRLRAMAEGWRLAIEQLKAYPSALTVLKHDDYG